MLEGGTITIDGRVVDGAYNIMAKDNAIIFEFADNKDNLNRLTEWRGKANGSTFISASFDGRYFRVELHSYFMDRGTVSVNFVCR